MKKILFLVGLVVMLFVVVPSAVMADTTVYDKYSGVSYIVVFPNGITYGLLCIPVPKPVAIPNVDDPDGYNPQPLPPVRIPNVDLPGGYNSQPLPPIVHKTLDSD